jgi:hypothetical protein
MISAHLPGFHFMILFYEEHKTSVAYWHNSRLMLIFTKWELLYLIYAKDYQCKIVSK